jgi:hypothetical protein
LVSLIVRIVHRCKGNPNKKDALLVLSCFPQTPGISFWNPVVGSMKSIGFINQTSWILLFTSGFRTVVVFLPQAFFQLVPPRPTNEKAIGFVVFGLCGKVVVLGKMQRL